MRMTMMSGAWRKGIGGGFLALALACPRVEAATITNYVALSGSDANSGTSWAEAYLTITNALFQAKYAITYDSATSAVVNVGSGTFAVAGELLLDQPIAIVGQGRESNPTIIRQTAAARVFKLSTSTARMEGLVVENGTITATPAHGGGIYMTDGIVSDCLVRGCGATDTGTLFRYARGGGIYMTGGVVEDTAVTNNHANASSSNRSAESHGGGVFMQGGLIRRVLLAHNSCTGGGRTYPRGGGVFVNGAGAVVENSLVRTNSTADVGLDGAGGGGVYLAAGTLRNCTVVDNSAKKSTHLGGGILQAGGTVVNCIAARNVAGTGADYSGTDRDVAHSRASELKAGIDGNVVADPLFENPEAGNYRLKYGSPCIDGGADLTGVVTDDMEGRTRPLDGIGDGSAAYDMGAYETPLSSEYGCLFRADNVRGYISHEVVFTAYLAGTGGDTNITAYVWQFGGGGPTQAGHDKKVVTNVFQPGVYTIGLTVTNILGNAAAFERQNYVLVLGDTFHVAADGGNVPPYANWTDALTGFMDAYDLAYETSFNAATSTVINVSTGTFTATKEILLDQPIRVIGQGHEGAPSIIRQTAAARVFNLSTNAARLEGLVIENGAATATSGTLTFLGGGVYMTEGLVTNCVIRGCRAVAGGYDPPMPYASGGGIYMTGGVVDKTVVSNNYAHAGCSNRSGGSPSHGGGVYASGGTLRRTLVAHNWATGASDETAWGGGIYLGGAGAVVESCLIQANWIQDAGYNGGGGGGGVVLASGTLRNCTIVTNECDHADHTGGGILQAGGTMINTIVWDNTAENAPDYSGSGQDVTYSLAPELTDGEGNRIDSPLFVDAPKGNYRLTTGSPSVNAGLDQTEWMDTATDLDGNRRILGRRVDMGAYETFVPPPGTIILLR